MKPIVLLLFIAFMFALSHWRRSSQSPEEAFADFAKQLRNAKLAPSQMTKGSEQFKRFDVTIKHKKGLRITGIYKDCSVLLDYETFLARSFLGRGTTHHQFHFVVDLPDSHLRFQIERDSLQRKAGKAVSGKAELKMGDTHLDDRYDMRGTKTELRQLLTHPRTEEAVFNLVGNGLQGLKALNGQLHFTLAYVGVFATAMSSDQIQIAFNNLVQVAKRCQEINSIES